MSHLQRKVFVVDLEYILTINEIGGTILNEDTKGNRLLYMSVICFRR